jgi:2-dehydro-3-deoxyphosphogluconate aldolase / (4S)-4-hydroxy-2-oxoglutarate aldolase
MNFLIISGITAKIERKNMSDIMKTLENFGIIPIVKIDEMDNAIPLADALIKGNLPLIEITFRTKIAADVIKLIHDKFPGMLIGAGTVLDIDQVKRAVEAGSEFIVTPGFNPKVVGYCRENNIPIVPGVNSPTQIEAALELGVKIVKFFPAEASGGIEFIKAVSAPFEQIKFVATGGINLENLNSYLSTKSVIACGGSWMVKPDVISAKNFAEVTRSASESINRILGFQIQSVGINEDNDSVKNENTDFFSGIKINNQSGIKFFTDKGSSKKGLMEISTININRALFYLEKQGMKPKKETIVEEKGKITSFVLEKNASGFEVRIVQKK